MLDHISAKEDVLWIAYEKPVITLEKVINLSFNSTECGEIYVWIIAINKDFSLAFMNTGILTCKGLMIHCTFNQFLFRVSHCRCGHHFVGVGGYKTDKNLHLHRVYTLMREGEDR